ncbi:MAG: hypothetical protein ACF8R7_06745 [Phycisphaerales bacterium JB039]
MDRVDLANLAPLPGSMRISPMANPPAAEIARQRSLGVDAIDFSAAARRLLGASEPAGAAEPRPASGLIGARVPGAISFEQQADPASAPGAAPLPFYRNPAQANLAATAIAGARLDVTA